MSFAAFASWVSFFTVEVFVAADLLMVFLAEFMSFMYVPSFLVVDPFRASLARGPNTYEPLREAQVGGPLEPRRRKGSMSFVSHGVTDLTDFAVFFDAFLDPIVPLSCRYVKKDQTHAIQPKVL